MDLPAHMADALIGRCMALAQERRLERHPNNDGDGDGDGDVTTVIADDRQNSHDHGVVASARRALGQLPVCAGVAHEDVETAIADAADVSDDAKAAALVAYDSLRGDVDSPAFGISEKDAFDRVWSTGASSNLVIHSLASMIEDGQPVCHTGKMTRLASVLDDPSSTKASATKVQPVWAHKNIMTARAARIREEVLSRCDDDARQSYELGHGEAVEEEMRQAFTSFASEYIREHGLSEHVMTPVVDAIQAGF
jgi:hypothetical protein